MKWFGFTALLLLDALMVGWLMHIERTRRAQMARLKAQGIRATGRVMSLQSTGRHGTQQVGQVKFLDQSGAERTFNAVWFTTEVARNAIRAGGTVPLRYLPDDPKVALVDSTHQAGLSTKSIVGCGLFILALIVALGAISL